MSGAATDHWRCFVGVPIGEELRGELAAYVARLRERPDARALRWSDPAGWHVSLAFLGSVSPEAIPAVTRALKGVAAAHTVFSAKSGGVGAFPTPRDMRVLWYGIDDAAGRLHSMASDVRAALLLEDAKFRAHLSLARSREAGRGTMSLGTIAGEAGDPPRGEIRVDRLELYRSHVSKGPAQYEVLASVPLARP